MSAAVTPPSARGTAARPTARARVRRHPTVDGSAYGLAVVIVVLVVVGPWIAPQDPYAVDFGQTLLPPGPGHWLGTDGEGRDLLSRILVGGRSTLLSTFTVIVVAAVVGTIVGTLAAIGPRWADEVLMRVADVGLSVPALVLALGFAAALGASLRSAVIALCITWWPGYARLVRALVRETATREFIGSARVLGVSRTRLVLRHLLPNSLSPLYVQTTLDVAAITLVISGLSFIGVGAQPPAAEWGAMVSGGRDYILSGWWAAVMPGAAIAITAITFNLVGDALRVRNDPTLREH